MPLHPVECVFLGASFGLSLQSFIAETFLACHHCDLLLGGGVGEKESRIPGRVSADARHQNVEF